MRKRLGAMLLALTTVVMPLAGCSSANTSKETTESSYSSKQSDTYEKIDPIGIDLSGLNPSGIEDGLTPSGIDMADLIPTGIGSDGIISVDENVGKEIEQMSRMFTLSEEDFEQTVISITDEEADKFNLLYEENKNLLDSTSIKGNYTAVVKRDWSKYTSPTAKKQLTHDEKVFYDRLDAACREHLENPTGGFLKRKDGFSTIKGVKFSDLNIPKENISSYVYWFKYNNPQYYFLNGCASASSKDTVFVFVFNFAAALKDFGKTTNELFDKLDSWIAECSDNETTTFQKLLSANKKICESIKYDPIISDKDNHSKAEIDKAEDTDQSMYSVMMTPVTVCAGYAQTFTAMANAMGIDTITALSASHAWNTVKFDDNKYYFIDACWNDRDKGYNTNWFGVGTIYANSISQVHVYNARNAAFWAPDTEKNDYMPTGNDLGYSVKSPAKPTLKLAGSGEAGVKVAWDKAENAEKYQVKAYCDGNVITDVLTADTFKYIPYVNGAKTINVWVRSQRVENDVTLYSEWAHITTSNKDSKNVAAPTNVRNVKKDTGLKLEWDNSTKKSVLFCYNNDSTMSKLWFSYGADNTIGWSKWNPEKLTYFSVAAVEKNGDTEILSAPVSFTYSKSSGIKMISGGTSTGGTSSGSTSSNTVAAPENIKLTVRPSNDGNRRALQCDWDAVSGADKYEYEFARTPDYTSVAGRASKKPDKTSFSYFISDKSEHLYVRVRAVKGSGDNAVYSKWITADIVTPESTTAAPDKPAAPKNVSRTADADNEKIVWDKVQGATGYVLTLFKDSTKKEVWCEFNMNDVSIYLGPFADGKTYYGGVRSVVTKDGKSTYSDYTYFNFKHKA